MLDRLGKRLIAHFNLPLASEIACHKNVALPDDKMMRCVKIKKLVFQLCLLCILCQFLFCFFVRVIVLHFHSHLLLSILRLFVLDPLPKLNNPGPNQCSQGNNPGPYQYSQGKPVLLGLLLLAALLLLDGLLGRFSRLLRLLGLLLSCLLFLSLGL